jgi:hypothetical protein
MIRHSVMMQQVPGSIDGGAPRHAGTHYGNFRVAVAALSFVAKSEAEAWLAQFGNPE